jgi:hypothetical protein
MRMRRLGISWFEVDTHFSQSYQKKAQILQYTEWTIQYIFIYLSQINEFQFLKVWKILKICIRHPKYYNFYGLRNIFSKSIEKLTNLSTTDLSYKFRLRRVKPWVLLREFHRRTNPMALMVTILRSRNMKK